MNLQAEGGTGPADADVVFFKRQRIVRVLFVLWALLWLGRIPPVATRWPPVAELSMWLVLIVTLVGLPFLIRAARCTICGGGIKLNGRTCTRCGHVFSLPRT